MPRDLVRGGYRRVPLMPPMSLPRPCAMPGCPQVVLGAPRCPKHTLPDPRKTARYQKLAERMKQAQPWCTYCGTPEIAGKWWTRLTIDHIVPVSRGGTNEPSNLTVACYRCNRTKGDAIGSVRPEPLTNDPGVVIA